MTWVAISERISHPTSAPPPHVLQNDPHALLPRGSFVAEAEATDSGPGTRTLLRYDSDNLWKFSFNLSCDGDGRYLFQMHLAGAAVRVETPPEPERLSHPVRISWSWDAPGRRAVFSVQDMADGSEHHIACDTPFPLPLAEILQMGSSAATDPGSGLQFFAFSDEPMLPGPAPTLAGDTLVATAHGYRPVRELIAGDLIHTEDDGPVPLRQLIYGEVPALGWFRPLRVRAPYFDLRRDIVVARQQNLLLQGDTVEYLFGEEQVLAGIAQFTDGISVLDETAGKTVEYYQLVFDRHQIIDLGGTLADSTFWPASARFNRDLQQPGTMPLHKNTIRPVLRPYEALTLRALRHQ